MEEKRNGTILLIKLGANLGDRRRLLPSGFTGADDPYPFLRISTTGARG